MAILVNNRVQETCAAPGTGTVTLLGAVSGYRTFSAGIGANNLTYYTIADQTGSNWEVGIGTIGAGGTTLVRTTVLDSSNAGALTNFSSGTQAIWSDYPANAAVLQTDIGTLPNQIPLNQMLGKLAFQDVVKTGGSNTQIQFNNLGLLDGNSTYTMVSGVMKENGFNFVSQADVGYNPSQVPLNQYLGKLAFQDVAERNSASSLATSAGLTAVTAVTGSLTLATGGVTLANQTMASAFVWRIRAYGTYVGITSANTRQFTLRCYWGSTALTDITTGNVLATTQTTPWSVEFVITGSSATAVWVTGFLSSQVTSATIPLNNIATAAPVTGLTTNSTLDFRVGQTGTATGDTINVHSVTMERIK